MTKYLRHMVLISFRSDTAPEQIAYVEREFCALKEKINVIQEMEWGTNVSPENHSQGFTHCFFLTFSSEEDRDLYLPDLHHKNFSDILRPYIHKIIVIDYWTNN